MKFVYFLSFLCCAVLFNSCSTDSSEEQSSGEAGDFPSGAVDLGLPSGIKWASCNVGATKPEEYGGYYAWGEIVEKDDYDSDSYLYYKENEGWIFIGDNIGRTEYDVARTLWGGSWRMPTMEEMQELIDNCAWTWTLYNGIKGQKITGPNGNCIFLPAVGYRLSANHYGLGGGGDYWTSTLIESYDSDAYHLYFDSNGAIKSQDYRFRGHAVRPVTD